MTNTGAHKSLRTLSNELGNIEAGLTDGKADQNKITRKKLQMEISRRQIRSKIRGLNDELAEFETDEKKLNQELFELETEEFRLKKQHDIIQIEIANAKKNKSDIQKEEKEEKEEMIHG